MIDPEFVWNGWGARNHSTPKEAEASPAVDKKGE